MSLNRKLLGYLFSTITSFILFFSACLSAESYVKGVLKGQLGNQFFQIAATVSLALDNNATPVFPDLVTSKEWNIPLNYKKIFYKLNVKFPVSVQYEYMDPHHPFRPIPFRPNMSVEGWFQCEKYFKHHKEEILALFAPSQEIKDYLTKKYGDLFKHPSTVAIHYRSYFAEDPNQLAHPTLRKEYYENAIMLFPEDSIFVVCSNDISWCKTAFADIPRTFVYIEKEPHYHDLYLMSMCKHNIIANSSFSWWSAYMNSNPDKIIIAPKKWFTSTCGMDYRDIVPKDWILLE